MAKILSGFSRRWKFRQEYDRLHDWMLSYYDSVLRRFRRFPLPLRNRLLSISLKSLDRPFFVRLGRADAFVLEEVFLRRIYDSHLAASLGEVRQIVDLGGNIGMTVRLWLLRFPGARILVVEPDTDNCEMLRKNVGSAPNVTIVQAGIGATSRQAYLDTGRSECGFQVTDRPGQHAESIPITTMDEVLRGHDIQGDIDFLKCDIEGSERELFSDCRNWIGRVRNLSIEIHDDYLKTDLLADLQRNGGDFVVAVENSAANVLLLQRRG